MPVPPAAAGLGRQEDSWVIDHVGELDPPLLVVVGERDTRFHAGADFLARAVPGSTLHRVAGAGHHPQRTHADEVAAAVLAHLDAADEPGGGSDDAPTPMPLAEYAEKAEAWLERARRAARAPDGELRWGVGSDNVAVFHNLTLEQERACIDELRAWQRLKSDAGYGSISWPVEYGGAGLPRAYEAEFARLERMFVTPPSHEAVTISLNIEAPTILTLGTEAQKQRYVASLRRCDELCCQLFSEPGAGSDLGSISLRAERDGDEWVLNGQKVWTSGAQYADVGYVIARTDPDAPRQRAMTAFLVPMDAPGVEVRPLRQMTGGSSFNEVFFTDVRVARQRIASATSAPAGTR